MQFLKKVHIVLNFFENNPIISTFLVVREMYH